MIVKKLWPPVPERRFVFVAFENKLSTSAQTVALAEVLRYSANQKVGPPVCRLKNPRQHRCCCRLPVRAADHYGMLAGQKDFFQDFRQRAIWNSPVQHFLQ